MASYQAPQVDYNLYKPVMPQTNVGEVFQLMNTKQNIYNQNLASINSQISSMNDLTNSVSNEFVKQKIDKFNVAANDSLKKYANLDFSIQDNAKLVDNLYDPLVKDQDFLTDYSATSHYTSEVQKALRLKDSTKKEERDLFSLTNLEYVTGQVEGLRNAKNSKELKQSAYNVKNRYYTPYTNYSANTLQRLKDLNASVEYDTASNGYIVKTPKGPLAFEKFMEMTMTEQDKQQMRIEATVMVDKLVAAQGPELTSSQYIEETLNSVDLLVDRENKTKEAINARLKTLPPLEKMGKKAKEQYGIYNDQLETVNSNLENLEKRKSSVAELTKKLQDGTFSYDDMTNMMVEDVTKQTFQSFISGLADSYVDTKYTGEIKSDATYVANQRLSYDYTKLAQDKELELRKLDMEQKKLDKDYAIAGLKYGANGVEPDVTTEADTKLSAAEDIDNTIATKGGIASVQQSLESEFKTQWKNLHPEWQDKHWNTTYGKQILRSFLDPANSISTWEPSLQTIKQNAFKDYHNQIADYKLALQTKQDLLKQFNEKNGTNLQLDENGNAFEKTTQSTMSMVAQDVGAAVMSPFRLAKYVGISNTSPSAAKIYKEQVMDKAWSAPGTVVNTSKNIEAFKQFINQNADEFGDIPVQGASVAVGPAGRQEYDRYIGTSFYQFANRGNESVAELQAKNPGLENADLVLQGLRNLDGQRASKEISPSINYSIMSKGTKLSYAGVKIEDVFTKEGDKFTPEQIAAHKAIQQGVTLPLVHDRYGAVNRTEGKFNSNRAIEFGESFTVYKLPVSPGQPAKAVIQPKSGEEHFMHEYIGDKFPIVLENNVYKVQGSTKKIEVEASVISERLRSGNYEDLTRNVESRTSLMQSDEWVTKFNDVLQKSYSNAIKKSSDGQLYIENSTMEKINASIK